MSLYNLMHGLNPHAKALLEVLGITTTEQVRALPRFRDCYVDDDGHIVIFTRTGGGNRADYAEENAALAAMPGYIESHDWERDSTFAKWVFAVPPASENIVRVLADTGARSCPTRKFDALMADLDKPAGQQKPSTREALERTKPTMERLAAALRGGDSKPIALLDED